MSPRMRPSSTRKSTPSSAMVAPKALRRPRASITAMALVLLLCGVWCRPSTGGAFAWSCGSLDGLLTGCVVLGSFVGENVLSLVLQQQVSRIGFADHAQAPILLDKLLVDELLIPFQNCERVDARVG